MKSFVFVWAIIFLFASQKAVAQAGVDIESLIYNADSLRDEAHNYQASIQVANQALALVQKSAPPDQAQIALCYMIIGRAHKESGEYQVALAFYEKALVIRRDILKNPELTARTLNTMSSAESAQKNWNGALKYSHAAIRLLEKSQGKEVLLQKFYNNLANIYRGFNSSDSLQKAIQANEKSLLLSETTLDTVERAKSEYGIGSTLSSLNDFSAAHTHLNNAVRMYLQIEEPDSLLLGQIYGSIGVNYLNADHYQVDSALYFLKKSEQHIAPFSQAKPELCNLYYNLSLVYELQDSLDQAMYYAQKAYAFDQQNPGAMTFGDVIQMQEDILLLKKKEQGYVAQQIAKDRQITIGVICLFLLILIILILGYRNASIEKNRAQSEEKNARLLEELHQLRHDVIKNNILILSNQIDQYVNVIPPSNDASQHLREIFKIRKIIRRLLFFIPDPARISARPNTIKPFVLEMHEIAEDALSNQPVQNETRFEQLEDIPVTEETQRELGLFVTECFTNIRKHAKCTKASLRVESDFEKIKIFIKDNGIGFDTSTTMANHQHGLSNLKDRAQRMGWSMTIHSEPGKGVEISLVVSSI